MKRKTATVSTIAALVLATSAWAQTIPEQQWLRRPHRATLFVDGGIGVPIQPSIFKDVWNTTAPFTIGVGLAPLQWMDVNVVFTHASFGVSEIDAKREIAFLGVDEIQGGRIRTNRIMGTARFIAVPRARFNVFVEGGIGVFRTRADALVDTGEPPNSNTKVTITNNMDDVTGTALLFAVGSQYALNDYWTTYLKFSWNINAGGGFAPGRLVLGQGETPGPPDGDMQFAELAVGMMIRI